MPRPVSPWAWRICLRDHGPKSPTLLLTLYVIGTFMDRSGFAFPGQEEIAKGARTSKRTVQRHIDEAKRAGWLAVSLAGREGQGWRHNVYRAAVPDIIELSAKDLRASGNLLSEHGPIEAVRDDMIVSPPFAKRSDTIVSSPSVLSTDAGAKPLKNAQGDDNGRAKVTTSEHAGGDTESKKVPTQLCRTNSYSETHASITRASEEARKATRARVKNTFEMTAKSKSKRRLADQELHKKLRDFAAAGITSVDEICRQLERNYEDVGAERLWRIIQQSEPQVVA